MWHSNAIGNESTGTTNESGNFKFSNMEPGFYTINVEATGFWAITLTNVSVDPSVGRHLDIAMRVGESSSTITVEVGANAVQTESGVLGQLVTQEQVKSIN